MGRLREAAQAVLDIADRGPMHIGPPIEARVPLSLVHELRAALDAEPEPSPTNEERARVIEDLDRLFWSGQPEATIGECLEAIATWHLTALAAERQRCRESCEMALIIDSERNALAAAEARGLERAERECLKAGTRHWQNGRDDKAEACDECVDAIRALKEE